MTFSPVRKFCRRLQGIAEEAARAPVVPGAGAPPKAEEAPVELSASEKGDPRRRKKRLCVDWKKTAGWASPNPVFKVTTLSEFQLGADTRIWLERRNPPVERQLKLAKEP